MPHISLPRYVYRVKRRGREYYYYQDVILAKPNVMHYIGINRGFRCHVLHQS
jgi:hypothetical protein